MTYLVAAAFHRRMLQLSISIGSSMIRSLVFVYLPLARIHPPSHWRHPALNSEFLSWSPSLMSLGSLSHYQTNCTFDPLPTWLLKANVEALAPSVTHLINLSLEYAIVPTVLKPAYVTPLLKKAGLDSSDVKSLRSISNLSVVSNYLSALLQGSSPSIFARVTCSRNLQSAYRANHSTETAVLKVLADILMALDSGDFALLTLLDLSAAFDSVDHGTLVRHLRCSYGLNDAVLDWFSSYLQGRGQHIRIRTSSSTPSPVLCHVPQGLVLGPILFLLYTADLLQLIKRFQLIPHDYADDTQIFGSCKPSSGEVAALVANVSDCTAKVSSWMRSNRLQLNAAKTEVLWFTSPRRQHLVSACPVNVCDALVLPVRSVRDFGVHLDSDVSMRVHINLQVRSCFSALRQIRSVRRSIPTTALLTLIRALVISKVDYCISVLVGTSGHLLDRLQLVLNAAARLVFESRRSDNINYSSPSWTTLADNSWKNTV